MVRLHPVASFGVVAWLLAPGPIAAQPRTVVMVPVPAPASAVEHRIHAVGDLDRTFAFYRDVLRLPVLEPPADAGGRFPEMLAGTSGAVVRVASFELPGADAGLLLAEFDGIDRRPQRPRRTDPGASVLRMRVRDLDAVVAAARAFGTPVVRSDGELEAAVLVDPDGFFVEVDRPSTLPDGAPGNIVDTRLAFTVADPELVAVFYRDVLGFSIERGAVGTSGQGLTRMARIPGAPLTWEFTSYEETDRMAHVGRLQDPGTPTMAIHVPNVRVAAEAARRAGLPVLSAGGEPVMLEAGGLVLIRDPGGLLLELIERR